MKKVIVVLMIVALVCGAFVSCGSKKQEEKSEYNVKLTIKTPDETICDGETVTIEGTSNSVPTVLDVVLKYLDDHNDELTYETGDLGEHTIITAINDAKEEDGVFWQVLINGESPDKGRYDEITIEDANSIEFVLTDNLNVTETVTETEEPTQEVQTANDDYNG